MVQLIQAETQWKLLERSLQESTQRQRSQMFQERQRLALKYQQVKLRLLLIDYLKLKIAVKDALTTQLQGSRQQQQQLGLLEELQKQAKRVAEVLQQCLANQSQQPAATELITSAEVATPPPAGAQVVGSNFAKVLLISVALLWLLSFVAATFSNVDSAVYPT